MPTHRFVPPNDRPWVDAETIRIAADNHQRTDTGSFVWDEIRRHRPRVYLRALVDEGLEHEGLLLRSVRGEDTVHTPEDNPHCPVCWPGRIDPGVLAKVLAKLQARVKACRAPNQPN